MADVFFLKLLVTLRCCRCFRVSLADLAWLGGSNAKRPFQWNFSTRLQINIYSLVFHLVSLYISLSFLLTFYIVWVSNVFTVVFFSTERRQAEQMLESDQISQMRTSDRTWLFVFHCAISNATGRWIILLSVRAREQKMNWRQRESFLVCLCCLFLTVCYSDHQGQASAKRQGKFKKVLDELETLYNRASTALLPSGNGFFLQIKMGSVYLSSSTMSKHVNTAVLKNATD